MPACIGATLRLSLRARIFWAGLTHLSLLVFFQLASFWTFVLSARFVWLHEQAHCWFSVWSYLPLKYDRLSLIPILNSNPTPMSPLEEASSIPTIDVINRPILSPRVAVSHYESEKLHISTSFIPFLPATARPASWRVYAAHCIACFSVAMSDHIGISARWVAPTLEVFTFLNSVSMNAKRQGLVNKLLK
jgi:hypothetical protein